MKFFFSKKTGGKDLLPQAESKIAALGVEREALEKDRQQKLQRQVELWSILNLPPDLEAEYKVVSAEIASLIKKVACVDEYTKKLKLANYHCQNGECEALDSLLKAEDPYKDMECA